MLYNQILKINLLNNDKFKNSILEKNDNNYSPFWTSYHPLYIERSILTEDWSIEQKLFNTIYNLVNYEIYSRGKNTSQF
jgi:hypothetical protein